MFTLVVDVFLIKYHNKTALAHLQAAIREKYQFDFDDVASLCIGMTLANDRPRSTITLCRPGYVAAARRRFGVVPVPTPTHSPASFALIQCGHRSQYTSSDDFLLYPLQRPPSSVRPPSASSYTTPAQSTPRCSPLPPNCPSAKVSQRVFCTTLSSTISSTLRLTPMRPSITRHLV